MSKARKQAMAQAHLNLPPEVAQMVAPVATVAGQSEQLRTGQDRGVVTSQPRFVSTLPTDPYDGMEIYYNANTLSSGYHFRYCYTLPDGTLNPATYKWVYLGGSPLFNEVVTGSTRSTNTYGDLASTTGPTITVPLAGDWLIEVRAGVNTGNATMVGAAMSYDIGSGAGNASDNDAVWAQVMAPGFNTSVARVRVKTLTAGVVLTAKYRSANSVSITWGDRAMLATPIRVG